MQEPGKDINEYIYLSEVVAAAAIDMHMDLESVKRRFMYNAARGLQKFTNEIFKTGKRRAVIYINKSLNSATIDCDFIEEIFVGAIDKYTGEKIPFHKNNSLLDIQNIETIQDDVRCTENCTGCYSKAACNDLQTTQVLRIININGTDYNETKTSTLDLDGSYYVVTETPFYNNQTAQVEYLTKKEILTVLDLAPCGCIVKNPENSNKLKSCNYDCYCTYCSPVCGEHLDVGYKIFKETSTIKFDHNFKGDKFYMEWRGSLPKKNGEYVVPKIAKETLVEFVKYKEIANKKGVARWERQDQFSSYVRERGNMDKARGSKLSMSDIVYALTTLPIFENHR